MPRTIPPALAAHLAGEELALARCFRLVRQDGIIVRLTTHDADLVVDGETYLAAAGASAAAMKQDGSLAVPEAELQGLLDTDALAEQDLNNGLWDHAACRVFAVNWRDPAAGPIRLCKGWLGEVSKDERGVFRAEIRGLAQKLQQRIGRVYTAECDADIGSPRCGVPLEPPVLQRSTAYAVGEHVRVPVGATGTRADDGGVIWRCTTAGTTAASAPAYVATIGVEVTDGTAAFVARTAFTVAGAVESASSRRAFVATAAFPALATEWAPIGLDGGTLVFETGANAGRALEVLSYAEGGRAFTLFEAAGYAIAPGDAFRVAPACNKIPATCRLFGAWPLNFRGQHLVPGQDALLQVGRPGA